MPKVIVEQNSTLLFVKLYNFIHDGFKSNNTLTLFPHLTQCTYGVAGVPHVPTSWSRPLLLCRRSVSFHPHTSSRQWLRLLAGSLVGLLILQYYNKSLFNK